MQCLSYFPGYYSTRDLNVDVNGRTCSPCNDNESLKGEHYEHYFNGLSCTLATNQHFGKEALRQTILKQDVLFREQVLELHRLYRKQRELMDEVRRKELHRHGFGLEISHSNSFLSQIPSDCTRKTFAPCMPLANSACGGASVAETSQPLLTFMERMSMQSSPVTAQTEGCSNNLKLLESKTKKFRRRALDLQLPADAYIDSEEGESLEEEKVSEVPQVPINLEKRMSDIGPNNDVKRLSGSDALNSVFQGDSSSPGSLAKKTNGLAYLNKLIPLNSVSFPGHVTCNRDLPCVDLLGKTNSGCQSEENFQNALERRELESRSNFLHLEKKRQREWLPYNGEAGQRRSNLDLPPQVFYAEKLPTSSKALDIMVKHDIPTFQLLDQSTRNSMNERTSFSLEISKPSHASGASDMPSLHQLVPRCDLANSESLSISSWRKPEHDLGQNPVAVQALPCFNPLAPLNKRSRSAAGHLGDEFQLIGNSNYNPSFGFVSSIQNSSCPGTHLDLETTDGCKPSANFPYFGCDTDNVSASEHDGARKNVKGLNLMDVKSVNNMNLNEMLTSCSPSVQNIWAAHGEEKLVDSVGELTWLRAKPYHEKPDKKIEVDSMKLSFSPAVTACNHDIESKKGEGCNLQSNNKLLGFPISDKPHISNDHCSSLITPFKSQLNSFEDEDPKNNKLGVIDINVACEVMQNSGDQLITDDVSVKIRLDGGLTGSGRHIDLNSCLDEAASPSSLSVPKSVTNLEVEVELEAPVSPENKERSPPRGESDENLLDTPQLSGSKEGDSLEELIKVAAEAIVSISASGIQTSTKNSARTQSKASLSHCLHWFAGLATSVIGDPDNAFKVASNDKDGNDLDEFSSSSIDYFEAMTLKLTETKFDEYWCNSKSSIHKGEDKNVTLLQTRQGKGRTRRGRQRKDFQREILPCLVSLSRLEVTEDLQTIGGLMEAAGTPMEGTIRNASRNGRARGRRQSSVSASNVVEGIMCLSMMQQTDNTEVGFEQRSLVGWGKITRGRRGPRCPASNPPLILSQV